MEEVMRLLFVEDLPTDYELEVRELKKEGLLFQSLRVETEEEFCKELREFRPHVVISDYSMPAFNGMKALNISLRHDPFLPFIVCTGSMNEETAVECLKAGATDYVIKESMKRLPYAVKEAMLRKEILLQNEVAQRKLKDSEAQLRRAQKVANIGSWEFDFNTGLAAASEEARNIYGLTEESPPIEKIQAMVLPQYRPMMDLAMQEHMNSGKPYNVEFQIMRANDQVIRYIHSMAEYDSASKKLSGIIRDITERKNNEILKQEILVARESARFKQDFLARMSHEIRTPLTAITGMMEILANTDLDEKQKDYFETIKFASESLKNIINEVLDFSSIEAGEIKLRPVEFQTREIFIKSEKLFQSLSKRGLNFFVQGQEGLPKYIYADKQRIFQVISNLISNAVKYTQEGEINLDANVVDELTSKNLKIKIQVKDTGTGIPANLKEKLFKPFSQIHNVDDFQVESTGLGLSICKELASLLGGEIGVESEIGNGSSFWFTFLAKVVDPGKDELQQKIIKDPSKVRTLNILLAEDKLVNQKVISLLLNSLGHKVTIAQNGQEVVDMCRDKNYDIVLMDIQMPVMDGVEATKILKRLCKQPPPIVGLSASAFEGDREKYMAMGMDEYITKPVKIDDFRILLERLNL
jgi:PAS domain S-box-containing protein